MSEDLTREIRFTAAYDRRHPDPAQNYGVHGVDMRWLLKASNAVQFVVFTNWQLPEVEAQQEQRSIAAGVEYRLQRPMPADLGYHALKPQGDWTEEGPCDVLDGGHCHYDGSGTNAEHIFEVLVRKGSDAVWTELEIYYNELFS